ncbi:hypothetical protein B4U79_04328 [Dinothrombium tinctorium]|uniref:Nicotinamide-nucleotide adenylyltransferase n=1 Tax=Dinothrombium tinctorium TaxID=1965070 RepID=A0A443R6J9_9ACAR|nr:hypothetical protein B4U79_04328 [Dinothrombium tinctorium]
MKPIVLISCGSFNPITVMHLNMFQVAKHFLESECRTKYRVLRGIISPVNDRYSFKKTLIPAEHRIEMIKLALNTSSDNDWIRVDDFEAKQEQWMRTLDVLKHFEREIKSGDLLADLPNVNKSEVDLRIICGADLIETFSVPNLWKDEDIRELISNYGYVILPREGSNHEKYIEEHHILSQYKDNIIILNCWEKNDVSSTRVREAVKKGDSIKGLVEDVVEEYIKQHRLYLT